MNHPPLLSQCRYVPIDESEYEEAACRNNHNTLYVVQQGIYCDLNWFDKAYAELTNAQKSKPKTP